MKLFKKEDVKPFAASKNEVILQYTSRLEKHGSSKQHSLAIMTIATGASSDPHAHRFAEESFLIIRGEGAMEIDGKTFDLKPGDCIFVEPSERHTLFNTGDIPLECVLATGPAWHPDDSV